MNRKLVSWVVALGATLAPVAAATPAAASSAVIDPTRLGSLTVHSYRMGDDVSSARPASGERFAVAQVDGVDLTSDSGWREAARLASGGQGIPNLGPADLRVTDGSGQASFSRLPVGLYRVEQLAVGGVAPFYVTIPMTDPDDGASWLYDVDVHPKAPAQADGPDDGEPVYDLALRTWVSEVWRDGSLIYQWRSSPDEPGPSHIIPYVTYDDDTVDIHVGDLLVRDIELLNQGNRTARVDELVNYSGVGLEYADGQYMNTVPGHDNDGWELAPDGLWHMSMEDAGIVLAPGERFKVYLTLRVTPEALGTHADESEDLPTFVEISRFSGWVPAGVEPAAASEPSAAPLARTMMASFAQPLASETYDGVAGSWQQVPDVDSTPDRSNSAVEDGKLVYHSWEDNEVNESNTSMTPDDDQNDRDNDEDDHDGSIIRVVRDASATQHPLSQYLPRTGAEAVTALAVAGALLGAGAALVMLARRRRPSAR
ncbi:LPXTG cell wall anchor domain-containing protein [Xylanimonas ulmi]|uniref:LPXTG-motif cell wall-anchored protein n=1 Tax=Xylanimonas ulmi TaxID=228973 RepID=A0A4Q7M4B7_9MICO|nr:LPXTG cell wall anchor domain-containing protein [Xylanibacterium ulmi]RZS60829.1 LPXTG-motif cell wall-anchored protein [Xylanibacterium ulmi]